MMIEDLYGSVEKIEKHIESMMNNKINIEFIQKQVEKMLNDIEELRMLIEKLKTDISNDRNNCSFIDDCQF